MNYNAFFESALSTLKRDGRYRVFAHIERIAGRFPLGKNHTPFGTSEVVIWCSNDYLGMGQHPFVLKAMEEALYQYGAGAGGTRNISGTSPLHVSLEEEIAGLHDKEAALLFTSGYVANETSLFTLAKNIPNCIIFSDELNHASMIEGIRNSRAEKHIFKHNDLQDLERLLSLYPLNHPKLIAFESVYSMDGDISPLEEICALAKKYHALTYLDEVHGVGLYGHKGGGVAQKLGLSHDVDFIQGTFGKAIGLIGGYIAARKEMIDFIRSFAPGFIFTTALPPIIVRGVLESIRYLKESSKERQRHQEQVFKLKQKLQKTGIPFLDSQSHIVPVIVGEAKRCKRASDLLLNQFGIYVQPINYPTVPIGTERLRFTPTPFHTDAMIDHLIDALETIWAQLDLKIAA